MAPHQYIYATVDSALLARPGILHSAHLAAGSTASSAILYDHASAASGNVICKLTAAADGNGDNWTVLGGVSFGNGIYLDIGGTGAGVSVAVD